MPASVRIISRSPTGGDTPPLAPHPQLHMGFAQCRFQLLVLRFELDLARRAALTARSQTLTTRLPQQALPVMHRLLTDPSPAASLSSALLTPQHTQHHLELLLRGLIRRSRHLSLLARASNPNLSNKR